MLSLPDRASVERAIAEVEAKLAAILTARLAVSTENEVADMTHYLIVYPDDQDDAIFAVAGFTPLMNPIDEVRFPGAGFHPWWDWLGDAGGWFEMVVAVGDTGFAFVLLIENVLDRSSDLLCLCRTFSR